MKYLNLLLMLLIITSCKPEEEDPLVAIGTRDSLDGNWRSNCQNGFVNGRVMSAIYAYKITALTMEPSIIYYDGQNCAEANKLEKTRFVTTYTYSGYYADMSVQDLLYTPYQMITEINSRVYCGFSNWQAGVEKSVINISTNSCFGINQGKSISVSLVSYGDMLVEDDAITYYRR